MQRQLPQQRLYYLCACPGNNTLHAAAIYIYILLQGSKKHTDACLPKPSHCQYNLVALLFQPSDRAFWLMAFLWSCKPAMQLLASSRKNNVDSCQHAYCTEGFYTQHTMNVLITDASTTSRACADERPCSGYFTTSA